MESKVAEHQEAVLNVLLEKVITLTETLFREKKK